MRTHLIIGVATAALFTAACGNETSLVEDRTLATDRTDMAMNDPAYPDAMLGALPQAEQDAARSAQDFVNAAGQATLVEIRTAEMALERAYDPEVKAFAQKIVDDHTAANNALREAATAAALAPPPTVLDDFHMRRINDLNETDGDEDFDRDFMALQVDAKNDALDLFRDYARDGDLAQLQSFASQTVATLESHKTMAEELNEKVKDQDRPG